MEKRLWKLFNLKPCKEVGILKESIKNAILDGIIKNSYQEAYDYLLIKAKEIGIIEK
jgi:tRNA nucleotidyltransferase (CCA-adding enzyme)